MFVWWRQKMEKHDLNDSGIICIFSKKECKKYLVSAFNIRKRIDKEKFLLRKSRHENIFLQSAWNKHGESDFEFSVLEFCDNDNKKERKDFYIKKLKTNEYSIGYNLKTFENETIVTGVYMIMDIIEEK